MKAFSLLIAVAVVAAFLRPAAPTSSAPPTSEYLTRMGYYVYYDEGSWTRLQQQIDHLDIVAPYFFHLTPNGSIKELDEREEDVTAFIKAHNKRIIPIIQNEAKWDDFTDTLASEEQRERIARELAELAESRGFDGMQIDFEAVNPEDADLLTAFMEAVAEEFRPRRLIVSQAVVARSSDAQSEWGGAYDFRRLGEINDFVSVMAYDYNSTGSRTPGPVAPIWWVESVLEYATSRIPAEKVYLGVPFYGRDWNLETGPPAESIHYPTAARLLDEADEATGGFSEDEGAPWIRYTDENGDRHEVWYENAESLRLKLDLALRYHVAGFSAWRIGQEDPRAWEVIASIETPATPVSPADAPAAAAFFPETGHTLQGEFLDYWLAEGGLERFGFPRTEVFSEYDPLVGQTYLVQYFERARFEYHPEYAGTHSEVLLGHVGRWALEKRGIDPWATAVEGASEGRRFFPESGHSAGGAFLDYWERQGGLTRFGYPLTEEIVELSPEDGHTYVVQYYERARMELHTSSEDGSTLVLLGLLGNEMLRERGWLR
jgi:spore germination protein YaaH